MEEARVRARGERSRTSWATRAGATALLATGLGVVLAQGGGCASADGSTCGSDRVLVNGQCQCPVAGQTWKSTVEGCRCPGGATISDGKCVCPGGQAVVNDSCECPGGQTLINGVCGCQPPLELNNGVCRCGTADCAAGETCCSSSAGAFCSKLTDNANCGACFDACVSGDVCCPGDTSLSTWACQDINTSNGNCGGCGKKCPATQDCVLGGCGCLNPSEILVDGQCVCPEGASIIDNVCTCPAGATIFDGKCQCPTGQVIVNGQCMCGPAGVVAPVGGVCTCGGSTTGACASGGSCCPPPAGKSGSYQCVDETKDPNCGGCNISCAASHEACVGSRCVPLDGGVGCDGSACSVSDAGYDASGDAGCSTRYVIITPCSASACDNEDGSGRIKDTVTGLTWTQTPYMDPSSDFPQSAAVAYCAGLGMRLPSEAEIRAAFPSFVTLGVGCPNPLPCPLSSWTTTAGPIDDASAQPTFVVMYVFGTPTDYRDLDADSWGVDTLCVSGP